MKKVVGLTPGALTFLMVLGLPEVGTAQTMPAKATVAKGEIRTLADLLPQVAWDARGPLIVVDPAGTRRLGLRPSRNARNESPSPAALPPMGPDGRRNLRSSLSAFDRVLMPVGALSVVAPREMVLISETPGLRKSSLWEGMSREEKMLYILSTLSPAQWAKLGGSEGIGVSDLNGDARAAYLSLLPARFAYREGVVNNRGFIPESKPIVLSASERQQVKIRMSLTPSFQIASGDRSYTETSPWFRGMPGDRAVERDDDDDFDHSDAYGVEMKSRVPNKPKPSDLIYESPLLSRSVSLTGAKTMGELVTRTGASVGQELYADFRVAGLPIETRGASARAGDVLKALALAVCGTWRQVGDTESKTYVLTSDRIGAGTRRLRLAEWQADLESQKQQQLAVWRKKIADGGDYSRSIGYAADDPLSPKGALTDRFAASEKLDFAEGVNKPEAYIAKSDLTPAMQEFIRQYGEMYKHQADKEGWDLNRVKVSQSIVARFVLPDGRVLSGYANLTLGPKAFLISRSAPQEDFEAREKTLRNEFLKRTPPEKNLVAAAGTKMPLFFAVHTPEEASEAVGIARRYGFPALYLETNSEEIVSAAVRAASGSVVKIHVVASVFDVSDSDLPDKEQDRNLLGETGPEAVRAMIASARWKTYFQDIRRRTFPRPTEAQVIGSAQGSFVPGSPAWEECRNTLAELAAIPGLAGIALRNVAPMGYAGKRSDIQYAGDDLPFILRAERGFSPEMRRAFLKKESVDPIDLIPAYLRFSADLRQPFFLDNNARGESSVYDGRDNPVPGFPEKLGVWDSFRGQQLVQVLQSLKMEIRKVSPKLPIWSEHIPYNLPNGNAVPVKEFVIWSDTAPLPPRWMESESRNFAPGSAAKGSTLIPFAIDRPTDEADTQYAGLLFQTIFRSDKKPVAPARQGTTFSPQALDFSSMTLGEAEALLARWLRPVDGK